MDLKRSWAVEAGILKCRQVRATKGLRPWLAMEWSDQEEASPHPLNPGTQNLGVSFQIEFTPGRLKVSMCWGVLSPGLQGWVLGPQAESPPAVWDGSRVGCLWKCHSSTPPSGRVQGSLHAV